jgi:S-DNA-T family DNA segregation ATPase FtsK/SpoIIIE
VRASDGAEVQLALPGGTAVDATVIRELSKRRWPESVPDRPGPIRVRALPPLVRLETVRREAVRLDTLRAPVGRVGRAAVVLGVGGDAAEPLTVDLLAGRARLLVAGPPRSGRSTLLLSLLAQLVAGTVRTIVAAPPRSPLYGAARAYGVPALLPDRTADGRTVDTGAAHTVEATLEAGGPAVLLVDDCEITCDGRAADLLADLAASRTDLAVVLAGRSDDLAVTFRGLAADVRSAHCAVLLSPGPGDGELAGVRLPARRASGPPGRGLVIGDPAWGPPFGAAPVPLQVALPATSRQRPASTSSSSCVAYQDSS